MPRTRRLALLVVLALAAAACGSVLSVGREFPSPPRDAIRNGQTTKTDLIRLLGEPTEVGVEDGDPAWRWIYFKKGSPDLSKNLSVRFDAAGRVKSYSFSSNFPEDMKALR
ncbi:MAG: outer membrane protein assembly factor BamE domain-containing protein [Candidatus Rokuibacteriota bacterium]